MFRKITILVVTLLLFGCVSSEIKEYPSAGVSPTYKINALAVRVHGPNIELSDEVEKQMLEELSARKVKALSWDQLFYPGKKYSSSETAQVLSKNHIDNVLLVSVGASSVKERHLYSYATSTASAWGGSAQATTTVTPVSSFKRNTYTHAALYKVGGGEDPVWAGRVATKAGGEFFMSDSSTADSLTETLISTLEQKGVLPQTQ